MNIYLVVRDDQVLQKVTTHLTDARKVAQQYAEERLGSIVYVATVINAYKAVVEPQIIDMLKEERSNEQTGS